MTALTNLAGSDRMAGIIALLERNDVSSQASAELLRGGKNNRVIRLVSDRGAPLVLKIYFRSAADTRDDGLEEHDHREHDQEDRRIGHVTLRGDRPGGVHGAQ